MLFGLCIIAQVLQPGLEHVILFFINCRHRNLTPLIKKNLSGHRNRNRKTAQMFTLVLAFLIFAGTMFALQGRYTTFICFFKESVCVCARVCVCVCWCVLRVVGYCVVLR